MENFSLMHYLTKAQESSEYNPIIADLIAYELDRNNEKVYEALREIIFGENNTALLTSSMIKGIFKSHIKPAHQMLGDLLLAARLQEGLRQSIVESMDEGTTEAAIYMLKIILDHDMIRYSSVLRALAVWTGLDLEANNKRVAKQLIEFVYESLTNPQSREQGLTSGNFNILYTSLWATAFYEEEAVSKPIAFIMENGADHQKVAAQFFLTQSQNSSIKFELSHPYLNQANPELNFYLLQNYGYEYQMIWTPRGEKEYLLAIDRITLLEDKQERTKHFELFKKMFLQMPKKEITVESMVFQGHTITLSTDEIARKMLYLQLYDHDQYWLNQLIEWSERVSSDIRNTLLINFIKDFTDKTQREFLMTCLSDRSMTVRETAVARLKSIELFPEEMEKIESLLRLKTGSLRQNVIQILLALPAEKIGVTIERLLHSSNDLQRLAALDILTEIKDQSDKVNLFNRFKMELADMEKASPKERILIEKLLQEENYSLENGFGLFDPHRLTEFKLELPSIVLKDFLTLPTETVKQHLQGLADVVHEYRFFEYEVEWYGGSKETVHVGEKLQWVTQGNETKEPANELNRYPLSEVWKEYFNRLNLSGADLIQIAFYLDSDQLFRYYFGRMEAWELRDYDQVKGWRKAFLEDIFPLDKIKEMNLFFSKMNYRFQVRDLFQAFFYSQDFHGIFDNVTGILQYMIQSIPQEKRETEYKLLHFLADPWLGWAEFLSKDNEAFDTYFKLKYQLTYMSKFHHFDLKLKELVRAFERGLIDEEVLFRELMVRDHTSPNYISELTDPKSEIVKQYPFMQPIKDRLVKRILELELNRGDLPTQVSSLAARIERFEGIEYFVNILLALEKETFARGYLYLYGDGLPKKDVLSHLLKVSYPNGKDNAESLKQLIIGNNISEKRLLEAAMYAPQWVEIVEAYLHWEGMQSPAWYFHAHMNEYFSAEKETIVARYSPIAPQDFQDGAFDIHWFKESYEQMGMKRFQMLYECAKYISGGGNHRRSQLFADAVLGKLQLEETRLLVEEKRNKDKLLSYSLIPVESERDVYERYEFLQKFLKESKQFGSQRQASEAKTVGIAIENLARNAGYQDVIRLKWDMEAKKMEEIKPYLESKVIEDITVHLTFDENGSADILAMKDGKPLKSIPSKYNKHEYIVILKAIKADLREQYKRAKAELERSMVQENAFRLKEVLNMMNNPVLAPLISSLVLKAGNRFGYFEDGRLKGVNEEEFYTIDSDDSILIAHPVHLYESGQWSDFQRDLFMRKVKQPFKQVFRELYLANQDELTSAVGTRRFAGHQVQPKKTASLLKSRMWTVSYEEACKRFITRKILW
ncbi:DUF4132 domain-containing protein [Neobacillus sp. PS3-34]|uniref:DUF4132 domain-containing protein n=1 Tax=Neobacillus sp. PS3-34 TaxID=3070678 RepID=UPI0027E2056E|nr:DUF4132 domain-containing protein [Neobacillus sp. PS3-34]WML48978.1 DUF4132 domain-containing protein [Neobacillus sp. PS3-34]